MVDLKEILEKSDSILVDGNIFCDGMNVLTYLNLDNPTASLSAIDKKLQRSQAFVDVFNAPSTRTIPQVTKERIAYHLCVSKSLNFFAQQPDDHKELFEAVKKLHKSSFLEYEAADENSSAINHSAYETLHEMVLFLSKALVLKQDTTYLMGEKRTDSSYTSDTDERLASNILWTSMQHNHTPVLFSNDSDFDNLLTIIPWLLGSKQFLPHNQKFREKINRNRYEIYRLYDNNTKKLTLPYYTFNFQNNGAFWVPGSVRQYPTKKSPIGPTLSHFKPRPIKEAIQVQYKLYHQWEKLADQLQ